LPLEFSELSITSPPLTEAELLAQKKRIAKMKKGKQNEEKRPTNTGRPERLFTKLEHSPPN
jgi:hypothetical protein